MTPTIEPVPAPPLEDCETCRGTGVCRRCRGTKVERIRAGGAMTCQACKGMGHCPGCAGRKQMRRW